LKQSGSVRYRSRWSQQTVAKSRLCSKPVSEQYWPDYNNCICPKTPRSGEGTERDNSPEPEQPASELNRDSLGPNTQSGTELAVRNRTGRCPSPSKFFHHFSGEWLFQQLVPISLINPVARFIAILQAACAYSPRSSFHRDCSFRSLLGGLSGRTAGDRSNVSNSWPISISVIGRCSVAAICRD